MKYILIVFIFLGVWVPRTYAEMPPAVRPMDFREVIQREFGKRMVLVLECESGFRNYDSDGKVIVSPTGDYGFGQINLKTWSSDAKKMNIDITKMGYSDGLIMIRWVMKHGGIKNWSCNRLI